MILHCREDTCAGRLTLLSASAAMRAGDGGFGFGDGERDVERDDKSESLLAADLCALPAHGMEHVSSSSLLLSLSTCTDRRHWHRPQLLLDLTRATQSCSENTKWSGPARS
jgi:hypothetical protein